MNGDAAVLARLNDLLQLECDALASYHLAITLLRSPEHRAPMQDFLADHERHVRDLTAMIHGRGSLALRLPHIPTGMFKVAVQAAGALGDERAVLLAFRANEQQARDKYAREAGMNQPPEVAALLSRHADDEARHFDWVCATLDRLGVGSGTAVGTVVGLFSSFHGAAANAVEAVGRCGLEMAYRMTRPT
ncbi:ferritin-like domain-containing protein [Indioceanicola profundi]|uniref:ferritin-like domain-containing protein n=1 Tax=Indioceanicola profundi TaxID=2220096 RepID=UPI000E6ABDC9|nr:ferritin-like domain-containing protein [Indioceanicola profundi]